MGNSERCEHNLRLLEALGRAWGNRDVEAVLGLMTEDCVYEASVGGEPGTTYRGREELRAGIANMFAHDAGSVAEVSNVFVTDACAAWEWTYRWADSSGMPEERGCDLFEFREGLISRKNAFRKVRSR
jgi:taurine dehydrogenase small subunit